MYVNLRSAAGHFDSELFPGVGLQLPVARSRPEAMPVIHADLEGEGCKTRVDDLHKEIKDVATNRSWVALEN